MRHGQEMSLGLASSLASVLAGEGQNHLCTWNAWDGLGSGMSPHRKNIHVYVHIYMLPGFDQSCCKTGMHSNIDHMTTCLCALWWPFCTHTLTRTHTHTRMHTPPTAWSSRHFLRFPSTHLGQVQNGLGVERIMVRCDSPSWG